MKKPFVFIAIALLFTFLLVLYRHLGGFNEPAITFEPVKEYVLSGKNFQGKITDKRLGGLFNEMRNFKIGNRYGGALVMVWYSEPQNRKDSADVFIGIEILPGESLPERYDRLEIPMNGLVRATIRGHASVIPSPSTVVEKIKDFAWENSYLLQDVLIDKYLSDSVIYTEIPVK